MKITYTKTSWVDGKTLVSANNLNHIEDAISNVTTGALGTDQLRAGSGIVISDAVDGDKVIGVDPSITTEIQQLADSLAGCVKAVDGKGLSTNDLTDTLLSKLNSLENYNDSALSQSITTLQGRLDTLVSGNTTTAIDSFNEITNFLSHITDSTTLEGILAGINTAITNEKNRAISAENLIQSSLDTEMESIAMLESNLYNKKSAVQTNISEQDGFIYTSGSLTSNSSFKIRVFDITNIKSIRVQLEVLQTSGANAFAFYSVITGFSSANYISGMTFADFSAANKDVTVDVPEGALRLLICEYNANISTYTITDKSTDIGNSKTTTLEGRATTLEGRATTLEGRATTLESDLYDELLDIITSSNVINDKIFDFVSGQTTTTGWNINIFNIDEKYEEIDISCIMMFGSGSTMAYGFFNSTTDFTIETLISGISFSEVISLWTNIFTGKRIKVPYGAKSFAFIDLASHTSNWIIKGFYHANIDKITSLKGYVEEQVTFIDNAVQTHISEQNGFIYGSGELDSNSAFKIRVFDITNIKSIRVQLEVLQTSGANAFAFYSVITGFSSANYISGMTFADFSAANKDVTVDVPEGALRLLICEYNANISTYTISGYFTANRMNNLDERLISIEDIVKANKVCCWGDSITAGTTTPTYPSALSTLLGDKYNVENLGSGSGWIQDISARQGGVPGLLLNDLSIPEGTSDIIIPSEGIYNKYQPGAFQIAPKYNLDNSQKAYSPVMIDNVLFNMTLSTPASGYEAVVKINRIQEGDAFTIKAGTPIYPNSIELYRNSLATVFFMGTNNTQSCLLDLISYTDTIIKYHNDCIKLLNNANFLILGILGIGTRIYNRDSNSLSSPSNAELLNQNIGYELKMANEYGLRFINLRSLMSDPKAVKDAVRLGYMTQEIADLNADNDAIWQERGAAAYSFMNYSGGTDYTHPNAVGYKMIAWYVFNALKKIGI